MDEVHYLISDASRKVDVEAHVLRYWEEELELDKFPPPSLLSQGRRGGCC